MLEYSHNNTVTFGYGSGRLNEKRAGDTLNFYFDRCVREPESFKEECYRVARLVRDKADRLNRPIYVLQSGGMDCEVMMKAFIDQKIPIEPISFSFKNSANRHEMFFADAFCKKHGLKSTKFAIDAAQWIPTQQELFNRTFSASAFMLSHMALLSHVWDLGGMPVIGAGDVLMRKVEGDWLFAKQEFMLPWYWHMAQNNIDGVCAFFSWTPEILLSMLREPQMELIGLGNDKLANHLLTNARQAKYNIYVKHWPDLTRRPKFTGEEYIKDLVEPLQEQWAAEREIAYTETWARPYREVREMLEVRSLN